MTGKVLKDDSIIVVNFGFPVDLVVFPFGIDAISIVVCLLESFCALSLRGQTELFEFLEALLCDRGLLFVFLS